MLWSPPLLSFSFWISSSKPQKDVQVAFFFFALLLLLLWAWIYLNTSLISTRALFVFNTAVKIALETGSQRLKGSATLRRPSALRRPAALLFTLSENKVKVRESLIDAQLEPRDPPTPSPKPLPHPLPPPPASEHNARLRLASHYRRPGCVG